MSAIQTLSAVIERCPQIADIEINPLVVYEEGQGAKAVDVRIMIAQ